MYTFLETLRKLLIHIYALLYEKYTCFVVWRPVCFCSRLKVLQYFLHHLTKFPPPPPPPPQGRPNSKNRRTMFGYPKSDKNYTVGSFLQDRRSEIQHTR